MVYDARGRKIAMTDPDMGHWSYRYDALGELTEQTDADGHVIDTRYDLLGRPVQRIDKLDASTVEQTTAWVYDTRWKGALTSVSITKPDGRPLYAKSLTYTAFGAVADTASSAASGNTSTSPRSPPSRWPLWPAPSARSKSGG